MPQLQQGFDVFANWQTVVFCLAVYIITFSTRTMVETLAPSFAKKKTWTDILLPLGPIGTGVAMALIAKKFPWPMPIAEAHSAKIMYGAICGLFNGWMYSRVRAWFNIAADNGNEFAAKVLKRPPSEAPPPPPAPPIPASLDAQGNPPVTTVTTQTTVATVVDRHEGPITADQDDKP